MVLNYCVYMISVECGNLIAIVLVLSCFFFNREGTYFYSLYFPTLLIIINDTKNTFYQKLNFIYNYILIIKLILNELL